MKLKIGYTFLTVISALRPYEKSVYFAEFNNMVRCMEETVRKAPRTSQYVEFSKIDTANFALFCTGWMLSIQGIGARKELVVDTIISFIDLLEDISPEFDKLCELMNDEGKVFLPEFTHKVNGFPKEKISEN